MMLFNQQITGGGGGGGGAYDLVIHVTLDASGTSVANHDANSAECMAFVKAVVSGNDMNAIAICRMTSYDDEDDIYNSMLRALPLVAASTTSYGLGQYEADGGWNLTFVAVYGVFSGRTGAYQLTVSCINDDPELPPTVTFASS